MNNVTPTTVPNARTLLLPYAIGLIVAMAIVQTVVTVRGNIDIVSGILTAVVALGIVAWLAVNFRALLRVRFGIVIAHATAFAIITTSFNVHAVVRLLQLASDSGGVHAAETMLTHTPWFGATLLMSAAWGVGLAIHLVGTIIGRGWEK